MAKRRLAALLLALLLLPSLQPAAGGAESAASPRAAWWGETGMLDGWHIRLPVEVSHPLPFALRDATAGHDLALRDALLEMGWPSLRKSGNPQLQVFELDEHSVRVVEYRSLNTGSGTDGLVVGEVPSRVTLATLETSSAYHNRTSPDVHVEWVMPGAFAPGSTRYFMIYLDTKANGEKSASKYEEPAVSPLESRYWMSRGTTLYGIGRSVTVIALADETEATIEAYQYGEPRVVEAAFENPLRLSRDERRTVTVASENTLLRIRSNLPVLAVASADPTAGFIPSADGSLLGTRFEFSTRGTGFLVIALDRGAEVTVDTGSGAQSYSLHAGRPLLGMDTGDTSASIRSDRPVLVLAHPKTLHQFASPWGAPTGSRLVGLALSYAAFSAGSSAVTPHPGPPCHGETVTSSDGRLMVSALEEREIRGRHFLTLDASLPLTRSGSVSPSPATVTPGNPYQTVTPRWSPPCPTLVHTTVDAQDDGIGNRTGIVAFGGPIVTQAPLSLATPIGGAAARRFELLFPATVIAYHDATTVRTRDANGERPAKGLGAADILEVDANARAPVQMTSDKPLVVIPKVPGGYFAGLDESLVVRPLAKPEYRGFLLSLEPGEDATEPLVGNTGPGVPVQYRLRVTNLARDHRGEWVPDVVRLGLSSGANGWTASASSTELRLSGGETREVVVEVTPPVDAPDGARQVLHVSASSAGNPAVEDHLTISTTVRTAYDLGLWFDQESGPTAKTLTFEHGDVRTATIVVKNLATVPDRVLVTLTPFSPEWTAAFPNGLKLREVALDPGETTELTLQMAAPAANGSLSVVNVRAESLSSASAVKTIDATVRLRADLRVELEPLQHVMEAAPAEPAVFEVTLVNNGTAAMSIRLNATAPSAEGWAPPRVRHGEYDVQEMSGLLPGQRVPFHVTVVPPENATRGQRVPVHFSVETVPQFPGDSMVRETVDFLLVVGARHDLRVLFMTDEARPGAGEPIELRASIRNEGNGDEVLRVVPLETPVGATLTMEPPQTVPQQATAELIFKIVLPSHVETGQYHVRAVIAADDGYTIPWNATMRVAERRIAEFHPLAPLEIIAGSSKTVQVDVKNSGNVPLQLPPPLVAPEGWQYRWDRGGVLAPRETQTLLLELSVPRAVHPGRQPLSAEPSWATSAPLQWSVETVVLNATLEGTPSREGATLRLTNGGTAVAADVEVVLQVGNDVVDRARVSRIPGGGNASVVLGPVPEHAQGVIVVDPLGVYSDAPLRVDVPFAVKADTPGPPPATLLVALSALAWLLSRRPGRSRDD